MASPGSCRRKRVKALKEKVPPLPSKHAKSGGKKKTEKPFAMDDAVASGSTEELTSAVASESPEEHVKRMSDLILNIRYQLELRRTGFFHILVRIIIITRANGLISSIGITTSLLLMIFFKIEVKVIWDAYKNSEWDWSCNLKGDWEKRGTKAMLMKSKDGIAHAGNDKASKSNDKRCRWKGTMSKS